MKTYIRCFFFSTLLNLFCGPNANAVPTSFLKSNSGNMNDTNWYLLDSQNTQVYYPENAYWMGRYALTAIQEAYPYISTLLGVDIGRKQNPLSLSDQVIISNFPKIVLVLGDRLEGPGFANPVTMNIESQMIHPRNGAFFQHELVHRMMYEHNDIHLGAPGRLFSLTMLPTWWIEGLAEYLTQSVGRVKIDGMTRSMVSQNYWPTWERLHSLYNSSGDNNTRGYITSGEFLSWIFSQSKEKNLYKIHEELAAKTITPFFYSASDNWLKNNLNQTGSELYIKFKAEKKQDLKTYLSGIPSLLQSKIDHVIFEEDSTYNTYVNGKNTLIPKLTSKYSAIFPSLIVNTGTKKRLPISLHGTTIFAIENPQNSFFLTTRFHSYDNASYGTNIVVVKFKGNIFNLSDENIISEKEIQFASKKNPFVVNEILKAGNGGFFIHASLRGESLVYFFDTISNSIRKIAHYHFPVYPKFIGIKKTFRPINAPCVSAILNHDNEQTSIENICANGNNETVIPVNKLNIQDGLILNNGTLRLLVSWDKLLGFVEVNSTYKITPVAAFPDWIQEITNWNNTDNIFTAWVYDKGKYKLYKFDFNKLKENFIAWQKTKNKNPVFATFPKFTAFEPPFKKILTSQIKEIKNKIVPQINNKFIDNKKVAAIPAPYDHSFLFAFPYALPDILGGPSVNLAAIPYEDKMERDRVLIFGGYNFYLEALSGNISYINNRIFDGFALSLFAAPFFNGTYSLNKDGKNKKYYNYLLQEGVSLANIFKFTPAPIELQQLISITTLKPYSQLSTPPASVGPQKTNLLSLKENFLFNLFNHGFYLANENDPSGHTLVWKTFMTIGAGKFNSIDGSTNSQNNSSGDIDYINFNSSITSSLSYKKRTLTLFGKISTTQGPGTFNLKEYYSPYSTYILGSTTSLNYVSYPLLATDSLFDLNMGYWSGQTSLNYEFPIFKEAESLFLMSYVDNWHLFFSVNEGGVSENLNGSNFSHITTLSTGIHLTVDIKGFQLYPSLSYSQILEKFGWGVIFQVKLMDIM